MEAPSRKSEPRRRNTFDERRWGTFRKGAHHQSRRPARATGGEADEAGEDLRRPAPAAGRQRRKVDRRQERGASSRAQGPQGPDLVLRGGGRRRVRGALRHGRPGSPQLRRRVAARAPVRRAGGLRRAYGWIHRPSRPATSQRRQWLEDDAAGNRAAVPRVGRAEGGTGARASQGSGRNGRFGDHRIPGRVSPRRGPARAGVPIHRRGQVRLQGLPCGAGDADRRVSVFERQVLRGAHERSHRSARPRARGAGAHLRRAAAGRAGRGWNLRRRRPDPLALPRARLVALAGGRPARRQHREPRGDPGEVARSPASRRVAGRPCRACGRRARRPRCRKRAADRQSFRRGDEPVPAAQARPKRANGGGSEIPFRSRRQRVRDAHHRADQCRSRQDARGCRAGILRRHRADPHGVPLQRRSSRRGGAIPVLPAAHRVGGRQARHHPHAGRRRRQAHRGPDGLRRAESVPGRARNPPQPLESARIPRPAAGPGTRRGTRSAQGHAADGHHSR